MFNWTLLKFQKYDKIGPKVILKNDGMLKWNKFLNQKIPFRRVKFLRYRNSGKLIRLPETFTHDLVYFIGVLIGDGTVNKPIKREKGGYYWSISISGEKQFLKILLRIVQRLFNCEPKLQKKK